MASLYEVAAFLEGSLINPAPAGPRICPTCRGFPGEGYTDDRGCGFNPSLIDAVVPISYAPVGEQLHTNLRGYKDDQVEQVRRQFHNRLAAVLWLFLLYHEGCVADAAGVTDLDVVTVVPSKLSHKDDARSELRTLVGVTCEHTADRFERLLRPTDLGSTARVFDASRYAATRRLDGENVLLIDDTWTTGSSAQSAASALRQAGAGAIALVVIGRYVDTNYLDNGARLDDIRWMRVGNARKPVPFDWSTCAVHGS